MANIQLADSSEDELAFRNVACFVFLTLRRQCKPLAKREPAIVGRRLGADRPPGQPQGRKAIDWSTWRQSIQLVVSTFIDSCLLASYSIIIMLQRIAQVGNRIFKRTLSPLKILSLFLLHRSFTVKKSPYSLQSLLRNASSFLQTVSSDQDNNHIIPRLSASAAFRAHSH